MTIAAPLRGTMGLALLGALMAPTLTARGEEPSPLPANLPAGWYAQIETSLGSILARLVPDQAPQAVAHFAALAQGRFAWIDPATGKTEKSPYYDGIPVTRAVASSLFEAGGARGEGQGVPEVFVPNEGVGAINFTRPGRLGMARAPTGGHSGVRFFVTASGHPWFNTNHPCIGEVVEGLDVVARISEVKTYGNGRPMKTVWIHRIRVVPVGSPPPLPEPELYVPKAVQPKLSVVPQPPS
jgi:cyclophilin family peptidyl-prolyl cis-trans isomerase